jgi:adenylate cyclase
MGMEIERKFLVDHLPPNLSPGLDICQGYLVNQKDRVVRIRTKGDKGFLTVKGKTVGIQRREFEYEIPLTDARQLLDLFCAPPLVKKTRFKIEFKGSEWVIDRFAGKNLGLVVAEIELAHPSQAFEIPPWAGREVSHDPRYYNSNLIKNPYSAW